MLAIVVKRQYNCGVLLQEGGAESGQSIKYYDPGKPVQAHKERSPGQERVNGGYGAADMP